MTATPQPPGAPDASDASDPGTGALVLTPPAPVADVTPANASTAVPIPRPRPSSTPR
jgi:hypothetical protein